MEEIEQIRSSYKILKHKCMYFKNYLEHAVAISKRSSDLLFRALQIPRDISWNDPLLSHCVEAGERQRAMFDEMSVLYSKTLFKELDRLNATIVSEMRLIDEEMRAISEKPAVSLKELREARDKHAEAWMTNRQDPWLTELTLKHAIKEVLLRDEEANRMILSKIDGFGTSLQGAIDAFREALFGFIKIQEQTYQSLSGSVGVEVKKYNEADSFFDAASESPKDSGIDEINDEKMKEKIETSFETLIEGISKELMGKHITVRKNLEVSRSCICRVKRGYTGDWTIAYMMVTSTGYAHFLDISGPLSELGDSGKLAEVLRSCKSRGFGSMFDIDKPKNEFGDDREVSELNERIMNEIEAFPPNIFFSIKLNNNIYEIDKERNLVFIYNKHQNGLASLFGISGMKVKFFTLSSAWEMFFALKNENVAMENIDTDEDETPIVEKDEGKELRVILHEDNPWAA